MPTEDEHVEVPEIVKPLGIVITISARLPVNAGSKEKGVVTVMLICELSYKAILSLLLTITDEIRAAVYRTVVVPVSIKKLKLSYIFTENVTSVFEI